MTSIIIVTDDSGRVRQFRFPGFLPAIFTIVFFLFSGVFFWMISDYRTVRSQISSLDQLEMDNKMKRKQMILLAQRVDRIDRKVSSLKEFDRKLKGMVSREPEDEEIQIRGVGGTDLPFQVRKDSVDKGRMLQGPVRRKLRDLDNAGPSVAKESLYLQKFLEKQKIGRNHIPSIWPVRGWMVGSFGCKSTVFAKGPEFRNGIDISTRIEAPILATAEGLVSNTELHSSSGWAMTVNHGNGIVTRYTNLQKILLGKGSYVTKGETIALAGSSSKSKGPNLHYEIHLNRVPVNPVCYLPN